MIKRNLILSLFVLLLSAVTLKAAQESPNIVVILADDLGYSDLGCYGGEIDTPNIDALAAGGVRFTQLYNSARCCPSRASLMTGLYPSQAGIGDFTTSKPSPTRGPGYLGRLSNQCVTLAEVLKPAGYGCYYVGKWHMHPETGPIRRGFDEFYGYTNDHSHDQYDADYYFRLPEGRDKEIDPPQGEFYATDVFNEYALEFIRQGQKTDKPWFLFLGHSSPHFPVQAPAERADKYEATYLRGWDVLRQERFQRMKQLGLIDGDRWKLTPRSIVPVDRDDIANGFSGQENPAWDSLAEDRRRDLARRMAVFAAMVEGVDQGVGRIVDHLRGTDDLDNTLILFLSDNGACYEWGPFGFDGQSRRGETILHTGNDLRKIGGPGTHHSYGSAWANLGNTPFRLYKHFTHEGGISTPFIAHWPSEVGKQGQWIRDPAHLMDIMPTILDAANASYPATHAGNAITPVEGTSLLPRMRGKKLPERTISFDHQAAHALRQGDWKIVWSKRMPHEIQWELYNLAEDRCETNNLAEKYPERVQKMAAEWEKWARHVGVIYESAADASESDSPLIANRSLSITGHVESDKSVGVIVAQGGREHGYAVHLLQGKLAFDVRVNGQVTRIVADRPAPKVFDFQAQLTRELVTLAINGEEVAEGASPGLIPVQPKDPMSIGRDELTAAGDYTPPNPLQGTVRDLEVKREDKDATQFPAEAFIQQKSDRKPGPVMGADTIHAGLKSHDRALYIKAGWIRDPYITLGPDDYFYGTWYLLWQNTLIAPLSKDLTQYTAEPVRIDPAGSRPGPNGEPISRIGHEGATMIKVGGKYVHLGTAWSTDQGRKGSYNLYYCVADKIAGPYGPRKFAGRFLGHGTPFQDKDGKWWCTAFFNANVPPLPRAGIEERDLSENAQTINEQGVTIVPLDVRMLENGEVYIRAKDPAYATPGPDEAQWF